MSVMAANTAVDRRERLRSMVVLDVENRRVASGRGEGPEPAFAGGPTVVALGTGVKFNQTEGRSP